MHNYCDGCADKSRVTFLALAFHFTCIKTKPPKKVSICRAWISISDIFINKNTYFSTSITKRMPEMTSTSASGDAHSIKKSTDRTLSKQFDSVLPEAQLYRDLVEAERRIDATINRKKLDLQDTVARSSKKSEILRVFLSNSVSNQTWQNVSNMDDVDNNFDFDMGGGQPGSWNLRIEGRLVNEEPADSPTRRKFSSFFTSISVEFDTDELPEGNVAEWHESTANHQGQVEFDVLDVRRKGDRAVKAKITMQLKEYPDKLQLSPQLQNVLAIQEETKPGVVLAMWHYIRFHKLQDLEEKRIVRCDTALKALFGIDKFMFPQIIQLLEPHLLAPKPVVIEYMIQVDKENNVGENVYDIEVERDDPFRQEVSSLLENWNDNQSDIQTLDDQIALTIQAMNNSRLKHKFLESLSNNPAETISQWLDSQASDLRIIMSDRGFNEEEVRHSSFYTEEILNQSVHLFLNNNRR